MDARREAREQRKQELFRELAELEIEQLREAGIFEQTPHFSVIERAASQLSTELKHETQQQATREMAAEGPAQAACPTCGLICETTTQARAVTGLGGPFEATELVAHCRRCRRSFFPSAVSIGFR